MKKLIYLILLVPTWVFGQHVTLDDMVDDFCQQAEKVNWKERTVEGLAMQVGDIARDVRAKHAQTVVDFKKQYQKKYPNKTFYQEEAALQANLVHQLIDQCDSYLELTRRMMPACPSENICLTDLQKEIDAFLEANADIEIRQQMLKLYETIDQYPQNHKEQFAKDYPKEDAGDVFHSQAQTYLLQRSNLYLKVYVLSQSL